MLLTPRYGAGDVSTNQDLGSGVPLATAPGADASIQLSINETSQGDYCDVEVDTGPLEYFCDRVALGPALAQGF